MVDPKCYALTSYQTRLNCHGCQMGDTLCKQVRHCEDRDRDTLRVDTLGDEIIVATSVVHSIPLLTRDQWPM